MKALLIIDYTNDFVADQGKLTCGKPAQALEDFIVQTATEFEQAGDYVILPTDTHFKNDRFHPEHKLFPPHNIAGTWGHALYGKLASWYQQHQNEETVWQFAKNRYSAFANTNLDNFLRERKIDDLTLVGVCTDICVLHTAIAAYNLNYHLTILKDGVATFTNHGQAWALNHFQTALGATVK
ncbi:cysteine hydrolase [Lactobacillus alvi]|uniref:Cysteine hydrolase n=1 Tax=Limosilactobacillus alvi TaxID=990412 RepID=A0ABS2ERI4_9LACO|nr:isochorismatase family cysteine hydrolase [Limosilactobacillus alvi]MBM6754841.1 cysteine hydrolase [Limosilactobacillus alvi]